jgi:hypothetical protein
MAMQPEPCVGAANRTCCADRPRAGRRCFIRCATAYPRHLNFFKMLVTNFPIRLKSDVGASLLACEWFMGELISLMSLTCGILPLPILTSDESSTVMFCQKE